MLVAGTADIDDVDAFVADLDGIGGEYGAVVQPFDARYTAGREHLRRAREYADRAFERDENVARDRGMEMLLYAAGRRQIDDALEIGVEEGESELVVVVDVVGSGRPAGDACDDEDQPGEPGDACETEVEDADDVTDSGDGVPSDGDPADREAAAAAAVADRLDDGRVLDADEELPGGDPDRIRDFFGIGDEELAATDADLERLVCERVALLTVEK